MELTEFKDAQRKVWEDGDYRPVGRLLEPAARTLVDAAGVRPGQRVLDVATGSGSVAVLAAQAGAQVVGVDITDAWFEEARRRAKEAAVSVDLQIGDAEDLPVEDTAFDVVLSSFGCMFAPRHEVAAAELARVCRPGGTIGVTAWTPTGAIGATLGALTTRLPAPPAFVTPGIRWGDPDHVRALFTPHGLDVRFERHVLPVAFPSVAALEAFFFDNSGMFIQARQTLQDLGHWDETEAELHRAIAAANEATDGTYRVAWDYLLALATRQP